MQRIRLGRHFTRLGILFAIIITLSACVTSRPQITSTNQLSADDSRHFSAYLSNDQTDEFSRFAPIFISERTDESFNRIGKPRARLDAKGNELIDVDATQAVVYVDRQTFTTLNGDYTNLIYRIHFEKTPFSLWPFHITAGKNNGLLTIVTLDANHRPVLVTTVHTCGCFLAFVPTNYLSTAAYPEGWKQQSQWVYGMTLPGLLSFSDSSDEEQRIAIYLKQETHRVMDIQLQTRADISMRFHTEELNIASITELMSLPLGDGNATTSFFETSGSRKGYVKDSHKPFERLLVSWWAFDWRGGEDKAYGNKSATGTVFYTSLKPWNRQTSDMWPFVDFLQFWGWGL